MSLSDVTSSPDALSYGFDPSPDDPRVPFAIIALTSGKYDGPMVQGMLEVKNQFTGLDPDIILTTVTLEAHGPYLEVGRNKSIKRTLDFSDAWRWALLIDSDIGFHAEHVKTLIMQAEAILNSREKRGEQHTFKGLVHSGVYANFFQVFPDVEQVVADLRDPDVTPEVLEATHTGTTEKRAVLFDQYDIPYGSMLREPSRGVFLHAINIPRPDLPPFPVDCAGAGFLLIHRDIFTNFLHFFTFTYLDDVTGEKVTVASPSPWFDELMYRGAPLGEDMTFCMRVRALGGDITVHPNVQLVHRKTLDITC